MASTTRTVYYVIGVRGSTKILKISRIFQLTEYDSHESKLVNHSYKSVNDLLFNNFNMDLCLSLADEIQEASIR